MPEVTMSVEEYLTLLQDLRNRNIPLTEKVDTAVKVVKKTRKAHKYNKEYARQYAAQRKKHPRMTHLQITKKAHVATRKALK